MVSYFNQMVWRWQKKLPLNFLQVLFFNFQQSLPTFHFFPSFFICAFHYCRHLPSDRWLDMPSDLIIISLPTMFSLLDEEWSLQSWELHQNIRYSGPVLAGIYHVHFSSANKNIILLSATNFLFRSPTEKVCCGLVLFISMTNVFHHIAISWHNGDYRANYRGQGQDPSQHQTYRDDSNSLGYQYLTWQPTECK